MGNQSTSKILASLVSEKKTAKKQATNKGWANDDGSAHAGPQQPELKPSLAFENILSNILGPDCLNSNTNTPLD